MDKVINRIKVVYQRMSASDGDIYKDCETAGCGIVRISE